MFIVEQAHWYYEDFCRDADPTLPSLSLRVFAHVLAAHCPDAFAAAFGMRPGGAQGDHQQQQQQTALIHDIDAAMAQFNAFKAQLPTAGAALLDPTLTKVLMVRGYKKDASWGFPRGKLSKGETAAECAAREVLEETGIDISDFVDDEAGPCIEVHVNSQATTLFIVAGAASKETPVAALVRGEIGDIAWHLLADLPSTREAGMLTYKTAAGVKHRFWRVSSFFPPRSRSAEREKTHSFFLLSLDLLSRFFFKYKFKQVWPYIKPLRRWVKSQQKGGAAVAGGGGGRGGRGGDRAATAAKEKKRSATPAAAAAKKAKSSGALDSAAAAAAGPSTSKSTKTTTDPLGKRAKPRQRERGPRRAPAPAAAAEHLAATAPEPGVAWIDFSFERAPILAALRG